MRKNVLVICTGNTCRSQMAEGFLKYFYPEIETFSAGSNPGIAVNPFAVAAMAEKGIDISKQKPKNVNEFVNMNFNLVISVCDNANENCPVFNGKVDNRIHLSFPDPAEATGSPEEILNVYRNVRNNIFKAFPEIIFKALNH